MQKKLKRAARFVFASGLALLVLLTDVRIGRNTVSFLQTARADDSEGGCTFYQGFSMATVNANTGYTLGGQVQLSYGTSGTSGTFTASGGVSGSFMKCCMGSNAGSACNFASEYGGASNNVTGTNCGNTAVRPAHTAADQVCP
jgi:hypothetical protein